MTRKIFICIFFFAALLVRGDRACAQDQHAIDSLTRLLGSSTDSAKVKIMISLSQRCWGSDPGKAFEYGLEALHLAEKSGNRFCLGDAHNNMGDLYWYRGDYASSSDHYFKALKIYEGTSARSGIAHCYRNIGWVYYKQNNYDEALKYYNKSLAINKELGLKERQSENYNDLGIIYTHLNKFPEALGYYTLALRLQEELGNKIGMAANYGNLGLLYDDMGEINLAIENLERSSQLAEKAGNKHYLAMGSVNLGSEYAKVGRYEDAIRVLNTGLEAARAINYKESLEGIYTNLALVYAKKKNFSKAYDYMELGSGMKDSIYNDENSRQIAEMTSRYESEKKELTIRALEKDKALSDERLQREKNFKSYLLLFCTLIAAFAFVLFRGNVQKKKANRALSLAFREIALKNKDITDSINYSKRIQEAILPAKEIKYRLFPEAFVLFKPKDIVSGDFYWFAEKDGKRLIAACDCTGHGVPGSLMSMIGNNFLNQIVSEKGITAPPEILRGLDQCVRGSLKQDEQSGTADGMDIALLAFHDDHRAEFAGAQRPLWIVRTGSAEVEEIKGDKRSIGGASGESASQFSGHALQLNKGDTLYIFSDGYADQFGGGPGKKLTSRKFKEILLSIRHLPMDRQEKALDDEIEKWKGNAAQVDDILVIGIRV